MTEETIFAAALEKADASERAAFLDDACRNNAELRNRVEELLVALDKAGEFLNRPAVAPPEPEFAPTRAYTPTPNQDVDSTRAIGESSDHEPEDEGLGFLKPPTRPDSLGRIGHYEVLEVLGKGGFGIVFRAFDDVLQRVVAVKVLSPLMAATSPARKRFLREARSSAQVRHENVVQVYAVEEQPLPFLVMEFIPGETLQQMLDKTGPLEVAEVLRIGRQIAEGLAAAHANGLIHRDVKPANVLIESGPQHRAKLTDFGLARAADDASISQSGVVAGTPMYMAPEQAKGESLDHRADLFSLGSVLYAMLAGRPPFRANSTLAVLKRVAEDDPRPIREIIPEVPEWFCRIVEKLHAKNPEDRFQTAKELVELLGQHLAHLQQPSQVPLPEPICVPTAHVERSRPAPHWTDPWMRSRRAPRWTDPWIALAVTLLFFLGHNVKDVLRNHPEGINPSFIFGNLVILGLIGTSLSFAFRRRPVVQPPVVVSNATQPNLSGAPRRRPGRRKWAAIAAGVLIFAAGVVAVVSLLSPSHTAPIEERLVVVNVEELDAKEVRLRIAGKEFVFDRLGEHQIRLPVGPHQGEWFREGKPVVVQNVYVSVNGETRLTVRSGPTPPPIGPLDLIPLARPNASFGNWKREDDTIVCSPRPKGDRTFQMLPIPVDLPKEYEFEAIFERQSGDDMIGFNLTGFGTSFCVGVDTWPSKGSWSGLTPIDKKEAYETGAGLRGPQITKGKRHTFRCTVRATGVVATLDGKPLVDYAGPFARLEGDYVAYDGSKVYVKTIGTDSYRLYRLRLTPLVAEGR